MSALAHYERNEFEEAIRVFQPIADTSKILFNCGVIRATLGEHQAAVKYYQDAIGLDQYLAVAYFQAGVSNFLVGDFEEALANFNDTLLYLRGNNHIDYEQLGLKFKLYSCEVLFNRGLCYIYLQMLDTGLADMRAAAKEKALPDHDVINEAIAEKAEGYTVFSIPVGVIYRPSDAKVKNVRARDYLGRQQVRLVAHQEANQTQHKRHVSAETWARDDRPAEQLSYAATHLVRPNLRSRQQSEPPINRNMFPPTPPPDSEKPSFFAAPSQQTSPEKAAPADRGKRSHSASRAPKPERLDLGIAAFEKPAPESAPRRGAARSASERPSERRRDHSEDRRRDHGDDRDRRRLFGAVEAGDKAEDVGARLQQQPAGPSPTLSTSSRGSASTARSRRPGPPPSAPSFERRSDRDSHRSRPFSIEEVEEEPEVVDDGPRASSSSYGRIPIANGTPHGVLRSPTGPLAPKPLNIRAKVHFGEDTRYIITNAGVNFHDFAEAVARKFGVAGGPRRVKVRSKDEDGDLITMADQEDFGLAVALCEARARREGADVGRLEVCSLLLCLALVECLLTRDTGLGPRSRVDISAYERVTIMLRRFGFVSLRFWSGLLVIMLGYCQSIQVAGTVHTQRIL